jgi:LysR family glycine cleavage system transcriptional activator
VWLSLDQQLGDFKNSSVDIGIRMGKGPWPGLICTPIMKDRLIPVCSPALLASGRGITSVEDLKQYTLLHDQDPSCQWQLWLAANDLQLPNASKGPRYNSGDILITSAISGQGVALVSELLAAKDIAENRLVQILPQIVDLGDYFWLVTTIEKRESEVVSLFYQWILK